MGAEETRAKVIDDLVQNHGFSLASQTFVKKESFDAFKQGIPAPEEGEQAVYFLQPSGNGYEVSRYVKRDKE